jgi:hypothetical protein
MSEGSQRLPANCSEDLEQLEEKARASEVAGMLAIIFIHNEPDLRIE